MKFRKRPVEIEALRLRDNVVSVAEIVRWSREHTALEAENPISYDKEATTQGEQYVLRIKTLEGTMTARPGDYIIRGVQGEFYPCKPDIFEQTYEGI
jgi:hypothetical protein